jgi:hypothetical protein
MFRTHRVGGVISAIEERRSTLLVEPEGCRIGSFNPQGEKAMTFISSTFISASALAVVLSFSAVKAEPKQGGMSTGSPPAADSAGSDHPGGAMDSPGGRPDQSGAAAGDSEQMTTGASKGKKSAEGAPSEGQSGKGGKSENDNGMAAGQDSNATMKGNKEKGKTAEGTTSSEGKGKDAKSGGKSEGQDANTAEGKSGTDENASGKSKNDANAESKGDHTGKSARLESHDVSKVRTYFSQHRPNAQRIDRNQIAVHIGVGIPSAIVLYDLPPDVVVVSGSCPIKYFVWEADIVLVDSCTHEVVEIIPGVA